MNIAFIPVRCGSKSIPLKNIKIFCGKPLVYWSLKSLQDSKSIDVVYVATDCVEIESIVNSFSLSKVITYKRDGKNATDKSSTESVMLEFLNKNYFKSSDLFLLVQATSPLTRASDFDKAIQVLNQENKDSLLTCVRTKRFFWGDDNVPINYDFNNRPRRQDFQGLLMENGAFYINSVGNIKRDGNRLSGDIAIYEMEDYNFIEIDEDDDWIFAESLMYKHILKKSPCKKI
jgi:CMP-N-acetylneuraminic acid synthetase